jgi:MraZ protein
MATIVSSGPKFYSSVFRHGVDDKRRLQIPARWRPDSDDVEFTLILWPHTNWPEACLMVLPPEQMIELSTKLKGMQLSDPKAASLRRLLGSKSAGVSLDKGGRICLPEQFARAVTIDKEAVLVGLVDRFEIWNPERYDAVQNVDAALLSEAFKLI